MGSKVMPRNSSSEQKTSRNNNPISLRISVAKTVDGIPHLLQKSPLLNYQQCQDMFLEKRYEEAADHFAILHLADPCGSNLIAGIVARLHARKTSSQLLSDIEDCINAYIEGGEELDPFSMNCLLYIYYKLNIACGYEAEAKQVFKEIILPRDPVFSAIIDSMGDAKTTAQLFAGLSEIPLADRLKWLEPLLEENKYAKIFHTENRMKAEGSGWKRAEACEEMKEHADRNNVYAAWQYGKEKIRSAEMTDKLEGQQYLKEAALKNFSPAHMFLAETYLTDEKVQDKKEALKWHENARALNHPQAMYQHAVRGLREVLGIKMSRVDALKLIEYAAVYGQHSEALQFMRHLLGGEKVGGVVGTLAQDLKGQEGLALPQYSINDLDKIAIRQHLRRENEEEIKGIKGDDVSRPMGEFKASITSMFTYEEAYKIAQDAYLKKEYAKSAELFQNLVKDLSNKNQQIANLAYYAAQLQEKGFGPLQFGVLSLAFVRNQGEFENAILIYTKIIFYKIYNQFNIKSANITKLKRSGVPSYCLENIKKNPVDIAELRQLYPLYDFIEIEKLSAAEVAQLFAAQGIATFCKDKASTLLWKEVFEKWVNPLKGNNFAEYLAETFYCETAKYQNGEKNDQYAGLLRLAKKNYIPALCYLGERYTALGQDEALVKLGMDFLQRAADKQCGEALYLLAMAEFKSANQAKAKKDLEAAAITNGHSKAKFVLGMYLLTGAYSYSPDSDQGIKYLEDAAKKGRETNACAVLYVLISFIKGQKIYDHSLLNELAKKKKIKQILRECSVEDVEFFRSVAEQHNSINLLASHLDNFLPLMKKVEEEKLITVTQPSPPAEERYQPIYLKSELVSVSGAQARTFAREAKRAQVLLDTCESARKEREALKIVIDPYVYGIMDCKASYAKANEFYEKSRQSREKSQKAFQTFLVAESKLHDAKVRQADAELKLAQKKLVVVKAETQARAGLFAKSAQYAQSLENAIEKNKEYSATLQANIMLRTIEAAARISNIKEEQKSVGFVRTPEQDRLYRDLHQRCYKLYEDLVRFQTQYNRLPNDTVREQDEDNNSHLYCDFVTEVLKAEGILSVSDFEFFKNLGEEYYQRFIVPVMEQRYPSSTWMRMT